MISYSALIIDDEIENIALLKLYLNKYFSQIDSIYSSVDLKEGADYLLDYRPNILFLDFSFAEDVNSFKLLEIHNFLNTQIVFMCTEIQMLKKTPNLNNFSYIIKPIQVEEFINSVSKTIEKVGIDKVVSKTITNTSNSGIIAIPSINKIELISTKEILSCSADGKYTVFWTKSDKTYTSSRNLGEYQEILDPNCFFRIHHKHIVNIYYVISINKSEGYYCEMSNGVNLPISKRKQEEFNKFIRLKF